MFALRSLVRPVQKRCESLLFRGFTLHGSNTMLLQAIFASGCWGGISRHSLFVGSTTVVGRSRKVVSRHLLSLAGSIDGKLCDNGYTCFVFHPLRYACGSLQLLQRLHSKVRQRAISSDVQHDGPVCRFGLIVNRRSTRYGGHKLLPSIARNPC